MLYYICTVPTLYLLNFTVPEPNTDSTGSEIENAKNLMTAVGEVLNGTESAFIKVPPKACVHLTGLK